MQIEELKGKLPELRELAKELGVKAVTTKNKKALMEAIVEQSVELSEKGTEEKDSATEKDDSSSEKSPKGKKTKEERRENGERKEIVVSGVLELHPDGYGFLRSDMYDSGEDDTYVSPVQIRRFRLKTGDLVVGLTRTKRDTEKFSPLIYVQTVNGDSPADLWARKNFEDLTPIYPDERIRLEWKPEDISTRIIDLVSPIGKGQRGLIVSPPKAGKTSLLKSIANAIERNNPEIYVIVLLIDERPEEVTDMRRSVKGEVVASTFDELPQNHIRISEIVLERAKRLVEKGTDVVILLDSITRLSRAYNITSPPSRRTFPEGWIHCPQ